MATAAPWLARLPFLPATILSVCAWLPTAAMFRWTRGEVCSVVWQDNGRWQLQDAERRTHDDVKLLPGAYVGANALLLAWQCGCCDKRYRAALLADNCDADALRRLRVRLRATSDEKLFRQDQ